MKPSLRRTHIIVPIRHKLPIETVRSCAITPTLGPEEAICLNRARLPSTLRFALNPNALKLSRSARTLLATVWSAQISRCSLAHTHGYASKFRGSVSSRGNCDVGHCGSTTGSATLHAASSQEGNTHDEPSGRDSNPLDRKLVAPKAHTCCPDNPMLDGDLCSARLADYGSRSGHAIAAGGPRGRQESRFARPRGFRRIGYLHHLSCR